MRIFGRYENEDSSESLKLMDYGEFKNTFSTPINIKNIVKNQEVYLSHFNTSNKTEKE